MFDFESVSNNFELYESEGTIAVPPQITKDHMLTYAGKVVAFCAKSGKLLTVAANREQLEQLMENEFPNVDYRPFCFPASNSNG